MKLVNFRSPKKVVFEFRKSCLFYGVSQSELFRAFMESVNFSRVHCVLPSKNPVVIVDRIVEHMRNDCSFDSVIIDYDNFRDNLIKVFKKQRVDNWKYRLFG